MAIIPENAELTSVEAVGVLNVSRSCLIKLLDKGLIPQRKVGKHRWIRMEDVIVNGHRTASHRSEADRHGPKMPGCETA